MPETLYFSPPESLGHRTPHGHPERIDRFGAVEHGLASAGLANRLQRMDVEPADRTSLELCHSGRYIDLVHREIEAGRRMLSTGDTHVGDGTLEAALAAAGAVVDAVDAVVDGPVRQAFCTVRPPGHHARPEHGMGFCVFNNIAIGARHAVRRRGLGRVLIVDWDVHHGNGTQDIFYRDPSALFFSTHQSPWYPGTGSASETGAGAGAGTTINCPMAAGSGRAEVLGALRSRLLPVADDCRPDLVMISAGFDSRLGDPLGGFRLLDADFADLTRMLQEVADRHAEGRLVSVLEGGYSLEGLAAGVNAHVGALLA